MARSGPGLTNQPAANQLDLVAIVLWQPREFLYRQPPIVRRRSGRFISSLLLLQLADQITGVRPGCEQVHIRGYALD
jgi:hypothetical protein